MDVWVTGRTAARVEAVAAEVGGHALVGDVSLEGDVARWFEQAGPVDLLVNNAGVQGPTVTLEEEEPKSWWQVFEINVRSVFLCCHAVAPRILARGGGRIVNVTSGAAYLPPGGFPRAQARGDDRLPLGRRCSLDATGVRAAASASSANRLAHLAAARGHVSGSRSSSAGQMASASSRLGGRGSSATMGRIWLAVPRSSAW